MESNSYVFRTNSSSSSQFFVFAEEEKRLVKAAAPSFYSSLHAVRRRPPAKPMMKKPVAPFPPTKPKLYQVEPGKFKEVVQRLTAAPEFQRRRLQEMAPPALDLSRHSNSTLPLHLSSEAVLLPDSNASAGKQLTYSPMKAPVSAPFTGVMPVERKLHKFSETCGALSPLGFSLSPSAMAWPFSPLLSPGTLSSLDL